MRPSREDVLRLAALARISLAPAEVERLAADLRSILGHMDVLREVDTTGVPAFTLGDAPAPLREDVTGADPLAHAPAAMAPSWRDGFFTVPRLESHGGPEPQG
jgi:aspartyl-tRNA(Asn)/glutamyl-tRNA(Gln) amidotransferase subunit C